MRINLSFDKKSIKNAIAELEKARKKLYNKMPSIFVQKCLEWVQNRANYYLSTIPMDTEVTSGIQSAWMIRKINKYASRLVNNNDKAVFVEFGVGRVGERNSHPLANTNEGQNYQYDIKTKSKKEDGSWTFNSMHKTIDLNEGYYIVFGSSKKNAPIVKTKGSPANLYLYNAGMDLVSTGAYKKIWEQVLKENF